jgi:hypothetical protein
VHLEQMQKDCVIVLCVHVTEGGHASRCRMCRGSVQHVGYHFAQRIMSLPQVSAELAHRCGQCLMRRCVGVGDLHIHMAGRAACTALLLVLRGGVLHAGMCAWLCTILSAELTYR